MRHSSASSSLDEASYSSSTAGLKGTTADSCHSTSCCAQDDNHGCSSSAWSKEPSTSGGKKSQERLWKRAGNGKGETRINETQGDIDAQLLEQQSTNSSEFDSPSLSGSLPSVADSHCSHFSSELSYSDPETSRPAHPSCSVPIDPDSRNPATAFSKITITPMPEVENDRLEHYPSQSHHLLSSSPPASPKGSSGTFLYISEGSVADISGKEPEQDESVKENANNASENPVSQTRKLCLQTDI